MELNPDEWAAHFPAYLTQQQRDIVAREFRDFPGVNFYIDRYRCDYLQGDCWGPIPLHELGFQVAREVQGVILSNSCDIDLANKRAVPPNVIICPLISMDRYRDLLMKHGMGQAAIDSKFDEIRRQGVTDIVYFPPSAAVNHESLIILSKVFSLPMQRLVSVEKLTKKFTLSQIGFYLFSMKLAIHFCRLHEGVQRFPE